MSTEKYVVPMIQATGAPHALILKTFLAESAEDAFKDALYRFDNDHFIADTVPVGTILDWAEECRDEPPDFIVPPSSPPSPNTSAVDACRLLIAAYKEGAFNGGSIDWSDLDAAHKAAKRALGVT